MTASQKVSPFGLKLIKAFEGYRQSSTTLATGQRVIGYGHPLGDEEKMSPVSPAKAERLLKDDLAPVEDMVLETVFAPLSQSQFDAVCSLVFNIGPVNFMNSNVRHALNNGRILDAASAFDEWCKADIDGRTYVVDGLVRRRTAEKALFLRTKSAVVRESRGYSDVLSDESFISLSDEVYTPDSGVTNMHHAALDRSETQGEPMRRREDKSSAGVLTLSEREESVFEQKRSRTATLDDYQSDALNMDDDMSSAVKALMERAQPSSPARAVAEDSQMSRASLHDNSADKHGLKIPHPNDTPRAEPKADNENDLSPIAIAAAEVSDRLDALIDNTRGETDRLEANTQGSLERSSLNKRDVNNDYHTERAERRADAQPYQYANSVRSASLSSATRWPYAILMFVGGCLLSGGAVMWFSKADSLTSMSQFGALWAMIFGGIMLLGSLYYALRPARG